MQNSTRTVLNSRHNCHQMLPEEQQRRSQAVHTYVGVKPVDYNGTDIGVILCKLALQDGPSCGRVL